VCVCVCVCLWHNRAARRARPGLSLTSLPFAYSSPLLSSTHQEASPALSTTRSFTRRRCGLPAKARPSGTCLSSRPSTASRSRSEAFVLCSCCGLPAKARPSWTCWSSRPSTASRGRSLPCCSSLSLLVLSCLPPNGDAVCQSASFRDMLVLTALRLASQSTPFRDMLVLTAFDGIEKQVSPVLVVALFEAFFRFSCLSCVRAAACQPNHAFPGHACPHGLRRHREAGPLLVCPCFVVLVVGLPAKARPSWTCWSSRPSTASSIRSRACLPLFRCSCCRLASQSTPFRDTLVLTAFDGIEKQFSPLLVWLSYLVLVVLLMISFCRLAGFGYCEAGLS
jgi:hypothetical protein